MNSIDTANDEENYQLVDLPAEKQWQTWTAKLGPKKSKTAETIKWTDQPPDQRGRQQQWDVLREKQSLRTGTARSCSSPREVFDLLITLEMVDLVVEPTNSRINETIGSLGKRGVC